MNYFGNMVKTLDDHQQTHMLAQLTTVALNTHLDMIIFLSQLAVLVWTESG